MKQAALVPHLELSGAWEERGVLLNFPTVFNVLELRRWLIFVATVEWSLLSGQSFLQMMDAVLNAAIVTGRRTAQIDQEFSLDPSWISYDLKIQCCSKFISTGQNPLSLFSLDVCDVNRETFRSCVCCLVVLHHGCNSASVESAVLSVFVCLFNIPFPASSCYPVPADAQGTGTSQLRKWTTGR